MPYFVNFTVHRQNQWVPAMGVTRSHPFEFIEAKNIGPGNDTILLSWQTITEEEYVLYEKTFSKRQP